MIKPHVLAIVIAVGVSALALAQPPAKKAPDDPTEALALAIKLLEAKDHVGFVKRFMPPDTLAKALEGNDIDRLVKFELGGGKAERELHEFKLVNGAPPVFNDRRTTATFSAKDATGKTVRVKFVEHDGKWYMP